MHHGTPLWVLQRARIQHPALAFFHPRLACDWRPPRAPAKPPHICLTNDTLPNYYRLCLLPHPLVLTLPRILGPLVASPPHLLM